MSNRVFLVAFLVFGIHISVASAQVQGLEIGNKGPEIALSAPNGEIQTLSSLRGKVVLIDFWATWCAPCVREQSDLALLYKKFKLAQFTNGKGFEIYGVSLDSKKPVWESTIKSKSITWIQVSDLKFWRSPVAKTYNIQELPFNVLIDGKGIILAKNLHGPELEKEITRFLIDQRRGKK